MWYSLMLQGPLKTLSVVVIIFAILATLCHSTCLNLDIVPRMSAPLYLCENELCKRPFTTLKAMRSHLKQANSCKWWTAHSKRAEDRLAVVPGEPTIVPGSIHDMTAEHFAPEPGEVDDEDDNFDAQDNMLSSEGEDDDDDDGVDVEQQEHDEELASDDELFEVVPPPVVIGEAGPGPSTLRARIDRLPGARARYFDAEDDSAEGGRVVETYTSAGAQIRMSDSLYTHWGQLFGQPTFPKDASSPDEPLPPNHNIYTPFASKMDWEIAQWMVKDGIGHNSFNRLLAINGVQERLGLSYHNTAGLHDRLEAVPRRAGKWHVKHITFPDSPNEPFTLRHRDVLESIQSLWGDPELAKHLVYRPQRVDTPQGNTL
ncbi:hypothetical protein CYLTODRAFT_495200 [Cylindrobasidium torrendii FP15055 ss-10]|uniref:Uncharacterized protein n=1 Tax=Cylindrobasidium torrendii FP15055 ss-10 TaxID=1314674 RepID=A0A0D7AUL7_9AGAR|nr:hypothetical protein CYLTODRAFT_495200 [Cylindrobasidium torrendii FP15055 ss-10]